MRFAGKCAVVTGGASGIGRGLAATFLEEGANVVIVDVNDDAADQALATFDATGSSPAYVHCDVTDHAQVADAFISIGDQFGGIDILANSAGLTSMRYSEPFHRLTMDEIRTIFDVNVMGVIACTTASIEPMKRKGGGVIVNLSSIGGYMPTSPYAVSKLAVRGLTIAFATELAPYNIRVNAVAPGVTATDNLMAEVPESLIEEFVRRRQLIDEVGQVSDVVSLIAFLCSDQARMITGETFKVSGGYPLGI